MNTAAELIRVVHKSGGKLYRKGDKLRYLLNADTEALLVELLAQHKAEILSLLRESERQYFDPMKGQSCTCGSRDFNRISDKRLECDFCGKQITTRWLVQ